MRLIGLVLGMLLVLIQYPLWLGSGSWFRVWELQRLVGDQHERNAGLRRRNEGLEAEVQDLHRGQLAIEERARYRLGMIRNDEIFVQLAPPVPADGHGADRQDPPSRSRAQAGTARADAARGAVVPVARHAGSTAAPGAGADPASAGGRRLAF